MRVDSWLKIHKDEGINFDKLKAIYTNVNPNWISCVNNGYSTDGVPRFLPNYEIHENEIWLPRNVVKEFPNKTFDDLRVEGNEVDFKSRIVLRDGTGTGENQIPFVEGLYSAVKSRLGAIGQAGTGFGKAQPLTALVLTPTGYRQIGSLQVGDFVIGRNGKPTKVLGVYPQGVRPCARVVFSDGVSTVCDIEHLFAVQHHKDRFRGGKWQVKSINDILTSGVKVKDRHNWYIPMCEPIKFEEAPVPIDPYLLGCLLADGGLCYSVVFSNSEKDILQKVADLLPTGVTLQYTGYGVDYRLKGAISSGFVSGLTTLGLIGKHSYEKFVPPLYLFNSIENRQKLLMGLFDCDGTIKNRQIEYSTSSEQLAKDVQFLVESLGGTARISYRTPTFTYLGAKKCGRKSYRVYIKLPNEIQFWSSIKHENNFIPRIKYTKIYRCIDSIDMVEPQECVCIYVEDDEHLYLTNNCIVTHNTVCALEVIARLQRTTLVIVHTEFLAEQWIERALASYDIDKSEIGFVQQDKCDYKGKKLVVALAQSLVARDYGTDFYNYFGTVVVDECFSEDTEVLTENGWMFFKDLQMGQKVAQYSLEGVEFVTPLRFISHKYEGNLINIKGKQVDLLITPNHEQSCVKHLPTGKVLRKVKATDFKCYYENFIPLAGKKKDGESLLTAEQRFLIALQADGYIVPESHCNGRYSGCREVQFSFVKERKILRMRHILNECNFDFSENPQGNKTRFIVKVPISLQITKLFSDWVRLQDISYTWGKEFIGELALWDGSVDEKYPRRIYYSSKNKSNIDIVQAIASLSGFASTYMIQEDNRKDSFSSMHRILLWEREEKTTESLVKNTIQYNGMVYCVEVPSGHIITRRNNCVTVSGNCHRFAAPVFKQSITLFPAKYRIGISATPKRADGLEGVFFSHIGEIAVIGEKRKLGATIYMVDTPVAKVSDGYIASYAVMKGYRKWRAKQLEFVDVISYLVDSEARNKQIVRLLAGAVEKGRKILLLSGRRKHLSVIENMLKEALPEVTVGYFVGQMKSAEREESVKCQILLGTYQIAKEGLDIPELDTLILATPQRDIIQAVGRILRELEGKSNPVVIDLVDKNIGMCAGLSYARKSNYKSMDWIIK